MEQYTWATAGEQGDSSSTEDVESPRSVVSEAAMAARRGTGRWRLWRKSCSMTAAEQRNSGNNNIKEKEKEKEKEKGWLHNQVLRIKEEEMQISEDLIGDHYTCYNYVADCHSLDDLWGGRSILPASPLGSKRN